MMKKRPFISGAIFGAIVAAVIHAMIFRPPPPPFGGPHDPQAMERMFFEHFARELSLSPEQKEAISPIMSQLNRKMMALRVSQGDETKELFNEADREMAPLLNDSQRKKLADDRAHMEKMHQEEEAFLRGENPAPPHRFPPHGSPPPGPPPHGFPPPDFPR